MQYAVLGLMLEAWNLMLLNNAFCLFYYKLHFIAIGYKQDVGLKLIILQNVW